MEEEIVIIEDKNNILQGILNNIDSYSNISFKCGDITLNISKDYIDTNSIIDFIKTKILEAINV